MPCFYVPNLAQKSTEIIISGDEHHHIRNVFRKHIGDEILLTNGKGLLAKAEITEISKKETRVIVISVNEEKKSEPKIAVAFAILKNKHDNIIIEKCTELGVKEFFPIVTERTVRKPSGNTTDKFEKTAITAIKQCDNAFLPIIHETQNLSELLDSVSEYEPIVALEIGKHKTISVIAQEIKKPLCIIIGPEGGFSKDEVDLFLQEEIPAFGLGNHILRAETATIASVSQLVEFYLKKNQEYY
jgi:16S rRNA (uracil1498-N3)-methyltransferase